MLMQTDDGSVRLIFYIYFLVFPAENISTVFFIRCNPQISPFYKTVSGFLLNLKFYYGDSFNKYAPNTDYTDISDRSKTGNKAETKLKFRNYGGILCPIIIKIYYHRRKNCAAITDKAVIKQENGISKLTKDFYGFWVKNTICKSYPIYQENIYRRTYLL